MNPTIPRWADGLAAAAVCAVAVVLTAVVVGLPHGDGPLFPAGSVGDGS